MGHTSHPHVFRMRSERIRSPTAETRLGVSKASSALERLRSAGPFPGDPRFRGGALGGRPGRGEGTAGGGGAGWAVAESRCARRRVRQDACGRAQRGDVARAVRMAPPSEEKSPLGPQRTPCLATLNRELFQGSSIQNSFRGVRIGERSSIQNSFRGVRIGLCLRCCNRGTARRTQHMRVCA